MKEKVNPKMSLLEKLSFGAGNMGICLMTTIITVFAMYFYTDVVGITVLQAGTIIAIGGIVDAISDALMGVIVDHTKSRWGKCRPYLLFGAFPLAVACFLVFHVPEASPQCQVHLVPADLSALHPGLHCRSDPTERADHRHHQ